MAKQLRIVKALIPNNLLNTIKQAAQQKKRLSPKEIIAFLISKNQTLLFLPHHLRHFSRPRLYQIAKENHIGEQFIRTVPKSAEIRIVNHADGVPAPACETIIEGVFFTASVHLDFI